MPAEGSFRTDTPAATGLVRGTSYIVVVGSGGTCGATGDQPCTASMILLTDRNGHVGRVDVAANASSVAPVQLSRAGDAAAASGSVATAAHLEPAALAQLESVAHIRNDAAASHTTELAAQAIAATLVPVAAGVTTAPADGSVLGSQAQKPAETVSTPHATSDSQPATPAAQHGDDSGQGTSGAAHGKAPAAPAPTTSSPSAPPPSKHTDAVAPPKVTAPAAVTPPPHVDTSNASPTGSSTKSTPATPPASGDSGKSDKSGKSKPATTATSATSGQLRQIEPPATPAMRLRTDSERTPARRAFSGVRAAANRGANFSRQACATHGACRLHLACAKPAAKLSCTPSMAIGAANLALRHLVHQPPGGTTVADQPRNVIALPLAVVELQNEHIEFVAVDTKAFCQALPIDPGIPDVGGLARDLWCRPLMRPAMIGVCSGGPSRG